MTRRPDRPLAPRAIRGHDGSREICMRPSDILRRRHDEVRAVIARYPVRNPRLFGSVARGDDGDESDLDLLVEPLETASLFDIAGLELELRDLLGIRVEVTTPGSLPPDMARRIRKDQRAL